MVEMDRKKFIDFLLELDKLRCERSKLIHITPIQLRIEKGSTSVKRVINFPLCPVTSSIPLKCFGVIDEICERYGVKVTYKNDTFNFTINIDTYD